MIKNYFKIAWRSLVKYKGFSFINIFGLATGMACSLLIFLFVRDETSYDRYHKDAGKVYRVVKDFINDDGSLIPDATSPAALAPAMQREIPGVETVTRLLPNWGGSWLVEYNGKKITEQKFWRADSNFFDVFTYPFIKGDPKTALSIFVVERKVKEIGIRKALGASVAGIVGLLSSDFLKLVLVAAIIASPFAWYFMHERLQDFAYRVNIGWWVFVVSGVTALLIALVTISFRAVKAAIANPVKSLRTE